MNLIICNPLIAGVDDLYQRHLYQRWDRNSQGLAPSGCRWCCVDEREHIQRRQSSAGCHTWERPADVQILARMRARSAASITAPATLYHVATAEATTWSYISDAPVTDEFCADCGDPECNRWIRTQERIEVRKDGLRLQRKASL
ncbi:hypothetical protein [Streptomyces griseorubiginosus]|uniref:hypothetical protein n=1 Tax=Streptomyces griseorubiginosus TaxID=67304 RepID=UPI0036EB410B